MKNAAAVPVSPIVAVHNGNLITDSLNIAKVFSKQHKDVLKAIKNLECSEDFRERNFAPNKIKVLNNPSGEEFSHYEITRDGFTMLAFGFTGKQAAHFKEAYIKAFSLMEEKLRSQVNLAILPAPPDTRDVEQSAREEGFVRAMRFFHQMQALRAQIDMDEQTLETLCFYRSLGLTQDEAARLCIIAKREVERVEEILRAHGITTTVVNMSIRRKQIKTHWTDLVTQAGLSALPGGKAVARIAEVR